MWASEGFWVQWFSLRPVYASVVFELGGRDEQAGMSGMTLTFLPGVSHPPVGWLGTFSG